VLVTLPELCAAQERLRGVAVHTPASSPSNRMTFGSRLRPSNPSAASSYAEPSTKSRNCLSSSALCGVITYSSGNHAQGVAYAARELGIKAVIVMPSNAPR